jgi:hypothetical protein
MRRAGDKKRMYGRSRLTGQFFAAGTVHESTEVLTAGELHLLLS